MPDRQRRSDEIRGNPDAGKEEGPERPWWLPYLPLPRRSHYNYNMTTDERFSWVVMERVFLPEHRQRVALMGVRDELHEALQANP